MMQTSEHLPIQFRRDGLTADASKRERFVKHLEPLQRALEGFCRRALLNPSDVEDVLQAAIMQAFRDFHLYVENTNFRAWIFRYVRLETLNSNRRHSREVNVASLVEPAEASPVHPMDAPGYEKLLHSPEVVLEHCEQALASAVRELPEAEREVLLLRAIVGFKYLEIADVLEIPVGTVMGRLSRARATLRQRLAEQCE